MESALILWTVSDGISHTPLKVLEKWRLVRDTQWAILKISVVVIHLSTGLPGSRAG